MQLVYSNELAHHGIKGQKWGVRRYQNADGSLTAAGQRRYGVETLSKKGTRIANKADRYIHYVEKDHAKTMERREKVREKTNEKYNKKIERLNKKPEKNTEKIARLDEKKNSFISNHKSFDKYVDNGYKKMTDTISKYRNVKLKVLEDKSFKKSPQYKNAVKAYNRMVSKQAWNNGSITSVALSNTIESYNHRRKSNNA